MFAGCGNDKPSMVETAEAEASDGGADAALSAAELERNEIARVIDESGLPMLVQAMRPSVREGWYEVHYLDSAGRDQLAYASDDAQVLFLGEMIDMRAGVSVSLMSALDVRAKLLENEAGAGRAINWAAPEPTQTVYAFTDPTCDACADLHTAIPQLTAAGISVTYLAFPSGGRGSESFEATAAAWCQPSRRDGFTEAMKGGLAGSSEDCMATVEHHQRLAQRMGVTSAPMLISGSGMHIDGFPGAAALIAQLAPPAVAAEVGGGR